MIRKVHISLLAIPRFLAGPAARPALLSSSSFPSSSMALSPAGVAAQPSPSTLAMKFVAMCSLAGCPTGSPGKRNLSTGAIRPVSARISPPLWAISMSPVQKAITPAMVMHRVIASLEESSAALVTSTICPVHAAYTMPITIIPAQR